MDQWEIFFDEEILETKIPQIVEASKKETKPEMPQDPGYLKIAENLGYVGALRDQKI